MGRMIVVVAVCLYASVVGCVMWHNYDPATSASADEGLAKQVVSLKGLKPYCGVTLRLQRVDQIEQYKQVIDHIADDGADTVSLVVDARQENASSTQMYVDMRKTMTVPQLSDIITHAKSRKLRVILMPVVLLDKPATEKEWRGTLAPKRVADNDPDHLVEDEASWHDWFDSYRDMIQHYARVAQDNGVDVLSVGSELVSSEKKDYTIEEWTKTIKSVREIYKGQLTYSSNWDRYWEVPFWKYLDLVGMNSYWTLGDSDDPSVQDIEGMPGSTSPNNWRAIQDKMFAFLAEIHKPVILLEVGWCSLSNAAKDPWDYTQLKLPADNELQRKLYEAFFQSWWGKGQCAGFMIWEMSPDHDETGKDYTPVGKPAEQVLIEWMQKARWTVDAPGEPAATSALPDATSP